MSRIVISTSNAPAAIGPYSQAILSSGSRTLYASGQIPLDPVSMELVGDGQVGPETEQVMKNIEAVLTEAGMTLQNVVRTTIFLVDMADFATVNEIYGARFPQNPPARACVQVAGLPKGVRVEIDFVAVAD